MRNQGLFQTLEKFQGVFQVRHLDYFQVYSINTAFCLKKKSRSAEPEIFLGFELELDFSRPGFSEIRVEIKRSKLKLDIHPLQLDFIFKFPKKT